MKNNAHSNLSVVDATEFSQERALIQKAQEGCVSSFHSLYEKYIGQVYALCYRLTADRGLAEDATQEVFIQLWRKLSNYSAQSKFSTWLHSVASNVTISYMRKQKSWVHRMLNIEESKEANVLFSESSCCDVNLEACILKLPERARVVFVLHAIEGYRHDDIARLMNMATGTSKAQFHRAKQLLIEWMGESHV